MQEVDSTAKKLGMTRQAFCAQAIKAIVDMAAAPPAERHVPAVVKLLDEANRQPSLKDRLRA